MTQENMENPDEVGYVGPGGYVALVITILFFSGLFYKCGPGWEWLGAFDFTTLAGSFGRIADGANFVGKGGVGARQGFAFSLTLIPSVMLALGVMEVVTHYGAIRAAQKLMTPLLMPILGVPGRTGLAMITDLQSTDAGAALTKALYDRGEVNSKQLVTICGWQYSGAGLIGNYFASGAALFPALTEHCAIIIPLFLCIVMKFVGGAFVRFMLNTVYRKDFQNA